MPDQRARFGVAVLPPNGDGSFATFDTERAAVHHADHSLPSHPDSRAWILWLGDGEAQLLGVRGAGQWPRDRIARFHVAPLAGGTMTAFDTHEQAREHASPGMVIIGLTPDGRVVLDVA
jgi:hypothetical protein